MSVLKYLNLIGFLFKHEQKQTATTVQLFTCDFLSHDSELNQAWDVSESNMGTNHDKRPKLKDSKLFDPPKTKVPSAPGGHQRLGSESLSPPDHAPTHSRTGSSPALMQNVEVQKIY